MARAFLCLNYARNPYLGRVVSIIGLIRRDDIDYRRVFPKAPLVKIYMIEGMRSGQESWQRSWCRT